jgi:hypothetical protein
MLLISRYKSSFALLGSIAALWPETVEAAVPAGHRRAFRWLRGLATPFIEPPFDGREGKICSRTYLGGIEKVRLRLAAGPRQPPMPNSISLDETAKVSLVALHLYSAFQSRASVSRDHGPFIPNCVSFSVEGLRPPDHGPARPSRKLKRVSRVLLRWASRNCDSTPSS